jgi:hypothetical protein
MKTNLKEQFVRKKAEHSENIIKELTMTVAFAEGSDSFARFYCHKGEKFIFDCVFPVDSIVMIPEIRRIMKTAIAHLIHEELIPDRSLPELITRRKQDGKPEEE